MLNIDADEHETLAYFIECAKAAEKLRLKFSHIIFVSGCELTFFIESCKSYKRKFSWWTNLRLWSLGKRKLGII